ncbi:MAG: hypothetical protein WBA12_02545 [Catalinimonas sp.]
MVAPTPPTLRTIIRSQHLRIEYTDEEMTLLFTATRDFVPEDEFREMLHSLQSFVRTHAVRKIIFDQRHLRYFHHRTQEWFQCNWQPRMARFGLTTYCYLLPNDVGFRLEADRCGTALRRDYPPLIFRDVQAHECQSLLEAMER